MRPQRVHTITRLRGDDVDDGRGDDVAAVTKANDGGRTMGDEGDEMQNEDDQTRPACGRKGGEKKERGRSASRTSGRERSPSPAKPPRKPSPGKNQPPPPKRDKNGQPTHGRSPSGKNGAALCQAYMSCKGKNKDNCDEWHPGKCKDFHGTSGKCSLGDKCIFQHDKNYPAAAAAAKEQAPRGKAVDGASSEDHRHRQYMYTYNIIYILLIIIYIQKM